MKTKSPDVISQLHLNEVEYNMVQTDIYNFLQHRLSGRVSPDGLQHLQGLSGSLFLIASILSEWFIAGNTDAQARLNRLQTSAEIQAKMLSPLDKVYTAALSTAFDDGRLWDMEIEGIKDILFTVLCARTPLNQEAIASIWNLPEEEVDRRLDSLSSVLSVSNDPERPINVPHPYFSDFMKDPDRAGTLCYRSSAFNLEMARQCLSTLGRELHQNLCKIDGRPANKSINPTVIQSHIGSGLRYSCIYLVEHCMQCDPPDRPAVVELIREFLTVHLLCWFECLSLQGQLADGVQILETILTWLAEVRPYVLTS
jgi:hypothetical protein